MRKRILLIDDEEDIREVAALALETGGDYEVITGENGRVGVEKALEERPDLILLDYMMPELDGPSTFAALRSHDETRTIPVIFMTAKVQPSDRRALASLDVRGVIPKPFDPLTLADEVARTAGW